MSIDGRDDDGLPLEAYLAGELHGESRARVEAWLRAVPEREVLIGRFIAAAAGGDDRSVPSAEEIVAPIRAAMGTTGASASTQRSAARSTSSMPSVPTRDGIARRLFLPSTRGLRSIRRSAVLGVLGLAVLSVAVLRLWTAVRAWRTDRSSHTYIAARMQRTTVTLPDGSRATLAPETRLRYDVDRQGARTVALVGEALFTVAPQSHAPFVVRTGAVTTRVLGTTFGVRRYPDDRATRIAVLSGRVTAGGHSAPVVLASGAVAYATDSTVTVSATDDPTEATEWTRGRLVFNDTPVSAMLATLGRWYGYEFHLNDTTLAAMHVSVALSTDHPADAMNTVKAVLDVTMTFDGNVITLRPERDHGGSSRNTRTREVLKTPQVEVGR